MDILPYHHSGQAALTPRPAILAISGSDSGGEAGLQADLAVMRLLGCHGLSALTATTAQGPSGLISVNPCAPRALADTLLALRRDFSIRAVKTGMLANAPLLQALLPLLPDCPLVVDPVLVSSSGTRLLDDAGLELLRDSLLPRATVITPNLDEARLLLATQEEDGACLASALAARYGTAVYLKGGHHPELPSIDHFCAGGRLWRLQATPVVAPPAAHGTGCRLASALACSLALGEGPLQAAVTAKAVVLGALRRPILLDDGRAVLDLPPLPLPRQDILVHAIPCHGASSHA